MKKKLIGALASVALVLFTSCQTVHFLTRTEYKDALVNGEYGSPKDSVLLFGYNVHWQTFIQQNPKIGYKFCDACREPANAGLVLSERFVKFLEPLPVGSELKLFSDVDNSSYGSVTTYYGIGGVDIVLNKPGLFYFDEKDPNHQNELTALKMLLNFYKGTGSDWELVIKKRIAELEK